MLVLLLLGRRIPTSIRLLLLLLVGAMRRHHHLLIVGVVEDRSSGNPRESHSRVVLTRKSHSRVVLTRESHSRVVVMMVLDRSEHVLLLLLLFVKPVRMLQQLSSTRCSCCTSREDGSILLLLVMVLPMLTGQVVACMPMVVATNASTQQQLRMIQRWASRSVKRVNPTARTVAVGAAAVERITRPAMVQQTVSRRSPRTTTTAAAAASVSPVANMATAEALSCWCVWAHHPTTLHIVSWVQGVQWRHTSTTARSIVAAAPEISGNRPDARCLQHEATLVRASAEAPAPLLLCVSPV